MSSWIGAGLPLTDDDVARAARVLDVDEAAVRAVIQVEAASFGFDEKRRPRILFEPHILYRELRGVQRADAVDLGLARRTWSEGRKLYGRTMDARYRQLDQACLINRPAAIKACSWGLGQVMGFNYRVAGFATIEAFVEAMKESEGEHLLAMAAFIKSNGLDRHLRARDWAAFARGYNGPGYAKNRYDVKLQNAWAVYASKGGVPASPVLRKGSSGAAVRRLQMRLNAHGFGITVDEAFGERTHLAVVALQERVGLTVDGVVGRQTWAALNVQPEKAKDAGQAEIPPAPGVEPDEPAPTGLWSLIAKLFLALFGGKS